MEQGLGRNHAWMQRRRKLAAWKREIAEAIDDPEFWRFAAVFAGLDCACRDETFLNPHHADGAPMAADLSRNWVEGDADAMPIIGDLKARRANVTNLLKRLRTFRAWTRGRELRLTVVETAKVLAGGLDNEP